MSQSIAMSESFGSVSVHLGSGTRIICHTYPDSGPILSVDAGDIALTVHGHQHKAVDATDVSNAQALADAVAVYLAECERIHHETRPRPGAETGTGLGCEVAADSAEDAAA